MTQLKHVNKFKISINYIKLIKMQKLITESLFNALKSKYESEILQAKATLLVYFNNPVAIGEHPQHLEEMDKLLSDIADANDKLEMLNNHFSDIKSEQ